MNDLFQIRVYYADTDAGGVVYHASYLSFYDRARTEFLRNLGVEHNELSKMDRVFAVRKINVEYLQPAVIDEILYINTAVNAKAKSHITIAQSIYNENHDLINSCEVLLVFVDTTRKRPAGIPNNIYERINMPT